MNKLSPLILVLACLVACSSKPTQKWWPIADRQLPDEASYSRLTWEHKAFAIPPAANSNGSYLMPKMQLDIPNSTVQESLNLLSAAIKYRTDIPQSVADRPVSLKLTARLDDILREIDRQAGVASVIDPTSRTIYVKDAGIAPRL